MTDVQPRETPGRRYSTTWSVIGFIVLGMVISMAIMLWRLRGE